MNKTKFTDTIKYFNPAWFASVMGTAVIPLALSFLKLPGTAIISSIFFFISIIMFMLIVIPWTLKIILFPREIKKDLNHPIAGNFFPTMPISLILFALNFLKFPTLIFSEAISHQMAFYLWIAGAIGIYLMGFVILTHIFRHKEIDISHATFGWYIPPVSKLLIPVAGFELAGIFPQYLETIFGLSMMSFGIGFFLFLFVGAVVYHRYIYHELPISRFAATFFIGIAPTAIISVILFKMVHLFQHVSILGISIDIFKPLASLAILFNWGLAAWWFVMALVIIVYYLKKLDLPYALSWWAFTFPSGALAVSTGVTMKITGFTFILWFYYFSLFFLLAIWLIVTYKTLAGTLSGKIFKPSH